jgi:outer membrane protein TolC
MKRRWHGSLCCVLLVFLCGCWVTAREAANLIILPEQHWLNYQDPAPFAPTTLPELATPRTVLNPKPDLEVWELSLDEAIRIALENANVIRVLAGFNARSSGSTIYDVAIANNNIDVEQARFDPTFTWRSSFDRVETPRAIENPFDFTRSLILGTRSDGYRNQVGLGKTNVVGGQWGLSWIENPINTDARGLPLNPANRSAVELSYTQPLLQGAGFNVNTAPIVVARLNAERSYFQYKDSVQEMVRGVIEGYWNLVLARTDQWSRKIQMEQAEEAYNRELARKASGLADLSTVSQAKVTYTQFRANLVAADAALLSREAALRNIMGIPPDDRRRIVPTSVPTNQLLKSDWPALLRLAEQRRPDIVELKLILEADQVRMIQAQNNTLPRLDAFALYRWNGLSGEMPNGERLSERGGEHTDWSVGINFSVPLGLRQGRAQLRQQELIIARDRVNLEQGFHAMVHDLAGTLRDLDNAYEQYRAFKETRAAAFDNLQVQIEQFRVGRAIFLNVLVALNDWGNAVRSEAQALIGYNVTLATLERQTGTILETHGLVFHEERYRSAGPLGIFGHGCCYPEALRPMGEPTQYPGGKEPAENYFDLRRPEVRTPAEEPKPGPMQPNPRPAPQPGIQPPGLLDRP